ncbi:MAG: FAD-dependent oxidoreductase, partial [Planctomycetes bacterium]|nr:FAD-dependent oxidoreductase [Planctomycetota bacterium]
FGLEFARRLMDPVEPLQLGRTFVVPYAPLEFAGVADELSEREPTLTVRLRSTLAAVYREGSRWTGVRGIDADGAFEVSGKTFIDASGDAIGALLAGHATEEIPPAERQLSSIVFHLQNVERRLQDRGERVAVLRAIQSAEAAGRLDGCGNIAFRPTGRRGEVVFKIALGGISTDGPSPLETRTEREARRRVRAVASFLRSEIDGFGASFVSHAAPQVGVRESRRIIGEYRLTRDDVLCARHFDDAITEAAWPIELWSEGREGPSLEYLPDGATYTIPRRALRLRDVDNAYGVGRCMSGTPEALGSARVIGTCLDAGFAIGRIAAGRVGTTEARP